MKITAHVPVQQYGYMEIEGTDRDLPEIKRIYNTLAEKPISFHGEPEVASSGAHQWKVIETFTGEKLHYDSEKHRYETLDGKRLMSGSKYAEQFAPEFDRERILAATAKKLKSTTEHVGAAWDKRGEMARHFGTALHVAMESWFRFADIGYGVPKHPFLKDVVESFPGKDSDIKPEIMVSDVKRLMVGQIDGLLVERPYRGIILDYKSDADVKKNLEKHWNQLSFYASILKAFDWDVPKLQIWNYTTKWEVYESPVLPVNLT